jgi:hypothetical protein
MEAPAIHNATPASYEATLRAAKGGDTVRLSPGIYARGDVSGRKFSPPLIIISADPARPAVFTDFKLEKVNGLIFRQVEFDNSGTAKQAGSFEVFDSRFVTFENVHIHGKLDGDTRDDLDGLRIVRGSDITVRNSEFEQLRIGMGFKETIRAKVVGNSFHDLRLDGIRVVGSSNIEIVENSFTDFYRVPGDHSDAIQFYKTGTKLTSRNLTVSRNQMVQGRGEVFQGVFFGTETEVAYENVKILDNLIIEGNHNAISIGGAKNVEIGGNVVISAPGAQNNWIRATEIEGLVSRANEALSFGTKSVTNFRESGNRLNKVPGDRGERAYLKWRAAHPRAKVSAEIQAKFPKL